MTTFDLISNRIKFESLSRNVRVASRRVASHLEAGGTGTGTPGHGYGTDNRIGVQVGRAASETAERSFGGKPNGASRRGLLSEYSVMLCMAS